jgi:hypothetical protein
MDEKYSIDKKIVARIELELRLAFGISDPIIDEKKFKLVRQELYLYYPDTLQRALPYVLIGFLRFGVGPEDTSALDEVIQFLNIKGEPYDERYETRNSWQRIRKNDKDKEEAVSQYSNRQAHAITIWLEAMQIFVTSVGTERLGYAIAYWSERSRESERDGSKRGGLKRGLKSDRKVGRKSGRKRNGKGDTTDIEGWN